MVAEMSEKMAIIINVHDHHQFSLCFFPMQLCSTRFGCARVCLSVRLCVCVVSFRIDPSLTRAVSQSFSR